jgi:hypothetical protein
MPPARPFRIAFTVNQAPRLVCSDGTRRACVMTLWLLRRLLRMSELVVVRYPVEDVPGEIVNRHAGNPRLFPGVP